MDSSKENKKRFFRKGQSQPGPLTQQQAQPLPQGSRPHPHSQRSFEHPLCCGRGPVQSPSVSSMDSSINFDIRSLPKQAQYQAHFQSLQNLQNNLQNIQNLQNLQNLQISTPHTHSHTHRGPQPKSAMTRVVNNHFPTNSGSLDETEINGNAHRKLIPVPRRARSAERFDGMRVVQIPSGSGNGELVEFNF